VQNNLIQILRRHYSNHLTLSYTGKVKKHVEISRAKFTFIKNWHLHIAIITLHCSYTSIKIAQSVLTESYFSEDKIDKD